MTNNNFDWGTSSDFFVNSVSNEIFENRIYERFFEVESDDIVLDIGASVGPFTYSILNKMPKHVMCLEPSFEEFKVLVKNTISGPVTCINKAITDKIGFTSDVLLFGDNNESNVCYSTTFKNIIDTYDLHKIDFIKTDCEGGEYYIFNEENFDWIKKHVRKIVGEWHLSTPDLKSQFRTFRDNFISQFERYEIFSVDLVDIKWNLWSDDFIDYYNEIIIYIDNRSN